jgi:GNAT superfamily N-acetyltransferase
MPEVIIRPAAPEDALALARVHVRSWQLAYRGLIPDRYLDRLDPQERARRYTLGSPDPTAPATIVACAAAVICGFATTSPARDADSAGDGELCALYVDPERWGQGVGATLVAAARAQLGRLGCRAAVLWLLAGNLRAERFYRRDGWVPDGRQRSNPARGFTVEEIRYRRALD